MVLWRRTRSTWLPPYEAASLQSLQVMRDGSSTVRGLSVPPDSGSPPACPLILANITTDQCRDCVSLPGGEKGVRGKWDTGKTRKKTRGGRARGKGESLFRGNSRRAPERKGMSILGGDKWTSGSEVSLKRRVGGRGMGPCGQPCKRYGPHALYRYPREEGFLLGSSLCKGTSVECCLANLLLS